MTDGDAKKVLGKDDILNADDIVTETVDVPEWGGSVIIKTITARQRDAWEASIVPLGNRKKMNMVDIRAKLLAVCIVNEDGGRMFTDADVAKLTRKSGKAVDRVFSAAQKLNKISDDDVEELAGNCEGGAAAD